MVEEYLGKDKKKMYAAFMDLEKNILRKNQKFLKIP